MDFPKLDSEEWEEMWECSFSQLASARDRLIQFKIMHRVYFMPRHLHKIYQFIPNFCWRCAAEFIHIFWRCSQVDSFWTGVAATILAVTTIQIPLQVEVCLLGLVTPLAHSRPVRTLLGILLYYARKVIVLQWKSPSAPSINLWKRFKKFNPVPFIIQNYIFI